MKRKCLRRLCEAEHVSTSCGGRYVDEFAFAGTSSFRPFGRSTVPATSLEVRRQPARRPAKLLSRSHMRSPIRPRPSQPRTIQRCRTREEVGKTPRLKSMRFVQLSIQESIIFPFSFVVALSSSTNSGLVDSRHSKTLALFSNRRLHTDLIHIFSELIVTVLPVSV